MNTVWLCWEDEWEHSEVVQVYGEKYQAEIWLNQHKEKKNAKTDYECSQPPWFRIEERQVI